MRWDGRRHERAMSLSAVPHWLNLVIIALIFLALFIVLRIDSNEFARQPPHPHGSRVLYYGRHTRPLLINRTNTRPQWFFSFSFFFSKSFSIASPVSVLGSLYPFPSCFRCFPSIEQVSIILLIFVVSNPNQIKSPASISRNNSSCWSA